MENIRKAFPEYSTTSRLDELRQTEYSYLDEQDHVYLDYTGAGLAAKSQHQAHANRLASGTYGNPHSDNPTSCASTDLVEETRARVLKHFHASPSEYAVIFTQNATGAARLVGESYPFHRGSRFVATFDNHNSVNGIREFAGRAGAIQRYIPASTHDLRVDTRMVMAALGPATEKYKSNQRPRPVSDIPEMDPEKNDTLDTTRTKSSGLGMSKALQMLCSMGLSGFKKRRQAQLARKAEREHKRGLFAYPAQSNFSGVRHPLGWIPMAQSRGYDVLLDAAAYLPSAELDLSGSIKPEFVLVSWYKLFGYPTGVGCLIARRDALARLNRPWFSGGTIQAAWVGLPLHVMAPDETAFEDGTLNFLSIPDVKVGLDWVRTVGMDTIATRVRCLTGWTLLQLTQIQHSSGAPMIKLYGPSDMHMRGGSICFNFLDAAGNLVDERLVAAESSAARISLRTGCFCNPGAGENAFGLDTKSLKPLLRSHRTTPTYDEYMSLLGMRTAGGIRISFGVASNVGDVERFLAWAVDTYRDRIADATGMAPRERC
jgi:selenocysteine lyase/cysteine desulfurase